MRLQYLLMCHKKINLLIGYRKVRVALFNLLMLWLKLYSYINSISMKTIQIFLKMGKNDLFSLTNHSIGKNVQWLQQKHFKNTIPFNFYLTIEN